jgi:uncharacterized FAD-dependent dehydrogenase
MGFRQLEIKMKTDFTKKDLELVIRKILKIRNFAYEIVKQSLDGRDNTDIHWMVRVNVTSLEIPNDEAPKKEHLIIPRNVGKGKHIVIVGSGPAGMFAALVLQIAGYKVTIIEQGPEVYQRTKDIKHFEKTGDLVERSNYSYGEGGAGTFSDGKLTSRTKSISKEKDFILEKYVEYGGPEEILYLSKPHLGSNLLIKIVKNFRNDLLNNGVEILFNTKMTDIKKRWGKIIKIETEKGWIDGDYFIIAPGHSSFETYKLLIKNGVQFKLKNFALGTRVEHYQEQINRAKWRVPKLPGVKAADYSLTYNFQSILSVYSFCMCPGGKVVPAPPSKGLNIVNGMSNYKRNYKFGNSAIVAGVSIPMLVGNELEPLKALEWLMELEQKFFNFSNSYKAPAVKVSDFMNKKITSHFEETSYPLGLVSADFRELFPKIVYESMEEAIHDFKKKIPGFEDGVMMGLESRTSAPIQLIRDEMKVAGFKNFYLAGEGSGLAGGIISSGADGIKCAMDIIYNE